MHVLCYKFLCIILLLLHIFIHTHTQLLCLNIICTYIACILPSRPFLLFCISIPHAYVPLALLIYTYVPNNNMLVPPPSHAHTTPSHTPIWKFCLFQLIWKAFAILSGCATCIHAVLKQVFQQVHTREIVIKEDMVMLLVQLRGEWFNYFST